MDLATLADHARQFDAPQLPHLASAAAAFYLGGRADARDRLLLWSACACMFAGLGWAGFHWGSPELPLSYRAFSPEAHVWRPVPGLVELRAVDHAVCLALGALLGGAAASCLWTDGWLARAAAALRPAARPYPALPEGGSREAL